MKKYIAALVTALALGGGVAAAPPAQAAAADANICLYVTSSYAGDTTDGITMWFSRLITGTPVPPIHHEILRGECSKTKYPALVPDKWMTPGTTTTTSRMRCLSQWGYPYYSSKLYGVSLISGKLSLYCKKQWKSPTTGLWS